MSLYFANYQDFIRKKENPKASEMLWGILNNQAWILGKLLFGVDVNSHTKVLDVLGRILTVEGANMTRNIADANTIHRNFFHDILSDPDFQIYKKSVEELIDKLDNILTKKLKQEGYLS